MGQYRADILGLLRGVSELLPALASDLAQLCRPSRESPGAFPAKPGKRYPKLQRQNTEISKQIFPEKEYRGLSPNFHIHASVSDLYIPPIGLPILLEEICRPILGLYKSLTDTCVKVTGYLDPVSL